MSRTFNNYLVQEQLNRFNPHFDAEVRMGSDDLSSDEVDANELYPAATYQPPRLHKGIKIALVDLTGDNETATIDLSDNFEKVKVERFDPRFPTSTPPVPWCIL